MKFQNPFMIGKKSIGVLLACLFALHLAAQSGAEAQVAAIRAAERSVVVLRN